MCVYVRYGGVRLNVCALVKGQRMNVCYMCLEVQQPNLLISKWYDTTPTLAFLSARTKAPQPVSSSEQSRLTETGAEEVKSSAH